MRQHHGPVQLEEVLGPTKVGAKSYSEEMMWYLLALLRPGVPHHVGRHVGLDEVCWPEVAHPTEEVEGPVPHGDQGLGAEHDRLPAVGGLGELGEDNPGHAGLYGHAEDALYAHDEDGRGTLSSGGSPTISKHRGSPVNVHKAVHQPDGVLGLHTEQEGGGEVHHVVDTHPVAFISLTLWIEVS